MEIAKEGGLSAITARSVAKRLGSSVAPVYVHFATVAELVSAVVERVFALSNDIVREQSGGSLFESIGRESLAFARRYPKLFNELIMQPNPHMASYKDVEEAMVEALSTDGAMRELTPDERRRLFTKMRIFQVGLSIMIANGHMPDLADDRAAQELLTETGEDLILAQQMKHRRT